MSSIVFGVVFYRIRSEEFIIILSDLNMRLFDLVQAWILCFFLYVCCYCG